MGKEYHTITELPGTQVTETQLRRAHQRYLFATKYCNGKRVLELGCGGGQGLEILSKNAKQVFGCDIDNSNLKMCMSTYANHPKIEILRMDAQKLEFEEESVNAIVLFETIYYLKDIKKFFQDAYRVLSNFGHLIICTANKDLHDFNPSPFSTEYLSVPELYNLCTSNGFDTRMYASFPDVNDGLIFKLVSFIKRTAVKLKLMPKTMKGKVLLRKIFLGNMIEYPTKLSQDLYDYEDPISIPNDKIDTVHTAIFAVCQK